MFDDDSYYRFKVLELLLVESDIKEFVYLNPVLSCYDFLQNFSDFIDVYINSDYMGSSFKENILNYLNIVRFNTDPNVSKLDSVSQEEKISFINKIIRKVNIQNGNKYIDYCRCELYKRTANDYYLNCPAYLIEKLENKLFDSIKYDHFVLISHLNIVNEEEFYSDFLLDLSNDIRYFETINCILNEYPQLFLNNLFIDRYNKVVSNSLNKDNLDSNQLLINSFNESVSCLKKNK